MLGAIGGDAASQVFRHWRDRLFIPAGKQGFSLFESLPRGQFGIPFFVIEFHLPEGGEKRPATVLCEFAVIGIGKRGSRRLAHKHHSQRERRQGARRPCEAAPPGGRAPQRPSEQAKAPHDPDDDTGGEGDAREYWDHGIRFRNVSPHFLRPDQIIHGDEVETRAKLVPEKPLRRGNEDQDAGEDGQERGDDGLARL